MRTIVYNIQEEYEDLRIDRFLAEQSEELSRSYVQKLIKDGHLLVNGKACKSSYPLQSGDWKRSWAVPCLTGQATESN